jgi:acetyl esterase/lipase
MRQAAPTRSREYLSYRATLPAPPRTDTVVDLCAQRALLHGRSVEHPPPSGTTADAVNLSGVGGVRVAAADADTSRVVLYLHGGGYAIGSSESHRALAGWLSQSSGAAVVVIDYRLAPEHVFPAAVDDAVAAYHALVDSGAAPVAVAGDSAGGGLAMAALVALRDMGSPLPDAAALLSPWTDLTLSGQSWQTRRDRDPIIGAAVLAQTAAWYLGGHDARDPLASPLFADLTGLPPLFVQVGDDEVLLDDALVLAERAVAAGGAAEVRVWPDMVHGWQTLTRIPEARAALAEAGEFLRRAMEGRLLKEGR